MQEITFCGIDIDERGRPWLAVEEINLWYDPNNRFRGPKPRGKARRLRRKRSPIIAKVKHGDEGIFVARQGDYCRVRIGEGKKAKEGWVTFYFIRELKSAWLNQRQEQRKRATLGTPVQRQ